MNSAADPIAVQAPEQQYRAGAYALLAALLRDVPSPLVLQQAAGLATLGDGKAHIKDQENHQNDLLAAMASLGHAAQRIDSIALDDEFHALFIGLGRGEVVPYGSWHMTGFLMEKPLGVLRSDLKTLGFERGPDIKEPEDHIAALFEVMAMLIQEEQNIDIQASFFARHLSSWADDFLADLATAKSVDFYRAVARFATAFIAFERQYFGQEELPDG